MSNPEGHSLAVRCRVPIARKTSRAEHGGIAPNDGGIFRKACSFPILSLSYFSSFRILHFFSFVFGSGGFLLFVLVYLNMRRKRLRKRTHATGE